MSEVEWRKIEEQFYSNEIVAIIESDRRVGRGLRPHPDPDRSQVNREQPGICCRDQRADIAIGADEQNLSLGQAMDSIQVIANLVEFAIDADPMNMQPRSSGR